MLNSHRRLSSSFAYITSLLVLAIITSSMTGCAGSSSQPAAASSTISWEEFQKMDEEQQRDPYVLDNLDESAKRKLDERNKRRR
jgi:hypothetical protein